MTKLDEIIIGPEAGSLSLLWTPEERQHKRLLKKRALLENLTQLPPEELESTLERLHQHLVLDEKEEAIMDKLEKSFWMEGIPQWVKEELLLTIMLLSPEQMDVLCNAEIICAEYSSDGKYTTDFKGLDTAIEILKKNENKHIYITSMLPKQLLSKHGAEKAKFLLNSPRVSFIDIISLNGKKIVDTVLQQEWAGKIDKQLQTSSFAKMVSNKVGTFLHDTHGEAQVDQARSKANGNYSKVLSILFALPEQEKSEKLLTFENEMLELLYLFNSKTKASSKEENLGRIISYYDKAKTESLHRGERLQGVFVDYDNTLVDFNTKKVNPAVLDRIKQFQSEGKQITIRTFGHLEEKQAKLDEEGLPFTIKSKGEFAGATVEWTIDDRDAEDLRNNAEIKTENHIQV